MNPHETRLTARSGAAAPVPRSGSSRAAELVCAGLSPWNGIAAEAFDPVAVELLLKAKAGAGDSAPAGFFMLVGTVRRHGPVLDARRVGKDLDRRVSGPAGLTTSCRSSPHPGLGTW